MVYKDLFIVYRVAINLEAIIIVVPASGYNCRVVPVAIITGVVPSTGYN